MKLSGIVIFIVVGLLGGPHSEYLFQKKYLIFKNGLTKKEMNHIITNDCRINAFVKDENSEYSVRYEYKYGRICYFFFEIGDDSSSSNYILNLKKVVMDIEKTNDSLPFLKIFETEILPRLTFSNDRD